MNAPSRILSVAFALAAAAPILAQAAPPAGTKGVGPGRQYSTPSEALRDARPGDTILVEGGFSYGPFEFSASGTPQHPITLRGIRAGGRRPAIVGGRSTVDITGSHVVLEGFEIVGGSSRCLLHHGAHVVVRDTVVHDCPTHGILSSDEGTGSLTLDAVEVYRCGAGDQKHSVYVASDETRFPGSVFRMQRCYVHDTNGGNAVKSRFERNELYSNWIEGAMFHELELIGPDGQDPSLCREDSDVVGNVIRKSQGSHYLVRIGGDGTGETKGRYRFAYNTFLLSPGASRAVFRVFDGVDCLRIDANAFYRIGGGPVPLIQEDNAKWVRGREAISGGFNWMVEGAATVPAGLAQTLVGPARIADDRAPDPRPIEGSPWVDAVGELPGGDCEIARPLTYPEMIPPTAALEETVLRPRRGKPDVGAFELGVGRGNPLAGANAGAALPPAAPAQGLCGCESGVGTRRGHEGFFIGLIAAAFWWRKRPALSAMPREVRWPLAPSPRRSRTSFSARRTP